MGPFLPIQMGLARTTARTIIFGPRRSGGLNLKELWVQQGVAHPTHLLWHLNMQDEIGKLLQIS